MCFLSPKKKKTKNLETVCNSWVTTKWWILPRLMWMCMCFLFIIHGYVYTIYRFACPDSHSKSMKCNLKHRQKPAHIQSKTGLQPPNSHPKMGIQINIKDGKWQEYHVQFFVFPKKDEMTLNIYCMPFSCIVSRLVYLPNCDVFLSIFSIISWNYVEIALKLLQQLPDFTLFLGSDLFYLHKHFTQFVQFLFFFFNIIFDFFHWWTPKRHLAAHLYLNLRPYCNVNHIHLQCYQLIRT